LIKFNVIKSGNLYLGFERNVNPNSIKYRLPKIFKSIKDYISSQSSGFPG
jgi:hypothetical protein